MEEVLEYLNPLSSLSRSDIYRIKKQKKEEKKPIPTSTFNRGKAKNSLKCRRYLVYVTVIYVLNYWMDSCMRKKKSWVCLEWTIHKVWERNTLKQKQSTNLSISFQRKRSHTTRFDNDQTYADVFFWLPERVEGTPRHSIPVSKVEHGMSPLLCQHVANDSFRMFSYFLWECCRLKSKSNDLAVHRQWKWLFIKIMVCSRPSRLWPLAN